MTDCTFTKIEFPSCCKRRVEADFAGDEISPPLREVKDLSPYVVPLAATLNLLQYWGMFAPYPHLSDFWHVMPGLDRDGGWVDVFSGRPLALPALPEDAPARAGAPAHPSPVVAALLAQPDPAGRPRMLFAPVAPEDGPDHYGGYRWRKIAIRAALKRRINLLFRYYCASCLGCCGRPLMCEKDSAASRSERVRSL